MKYPKGWKIEKLDKYHIVITLNSPANEDLLRKIQERSRKDKGYLYEGYMEDLLIYYYGRKFDYFKNDQSLKQQSLPDLLSKHINTKLLGKRCFDQLCYYATIEYGLSAYYTLFMEHHDHLYRIMFGNVQSEDKLTDIDKAILNTFHFAR